MKGIILAGSSGSRLYPATLAVLKQLLPMAETVDWFLANQWWWRPIREGRYRGERLGSAA